MQTSKVFQAIASLLGAIENCEKRSPVNTEWAERHRAAIGWIIRTYLPSGSGFDGGTQLHADSTPEKLIFETAFHHMVEGSYDGWTEHEVKVTPSLAHGFTIRVSGQNRNDIKNYIADTFYEALSRNVDTEKYAAFVFSNGKGIK